jgi:hypothetical protein
MRSTTYPSTHCTFICVLQIDEITSEPDDPKFSCNATMQTSPDDTTIDGMDDRDTMSVELHYYNIYNDEFVENAMVICIGTLCVIEGDSADPLLIIRSHCLTRFGMILPYYYYYYYYTNCFSAPGDPSDPAYPDSVPPSINAFLTFVGQVTHHHTTLSTDGRTFSVSLSVYNKTDDEPSTISTYRLLCIFPQSRRWETFSKPPNIGGYVQITGELIGLCDVHKLRTLCVLIRDLTFQQSRKPLPNAARSTAPASTTTSPETPRKRLRRRGEPTPKLQQTPSKRPRQESIIPDSSEGIIISQSSYTETIANEGDSDGNGSSAMGKGKRKKVPKIIKD